MAIKECVAGADDGYVGYLTYPVFRKAAARGAILIWTAILLVMLLMMVSLAVDFGRIVLARAQLQCAVDAAAREGAAALPATLSAVRNAVVAAGAKNTALGTAVQIAPADVEVLSFDGGADNAVRVSANLPVPLLFGNLHSQPFIISVRATARRQSTSQSFGMVGLNSINITGSAMVDSYNSSAGTYAATKSSNAQIASNGNISLGGASQVKGDAFSHGGTISSVSKLTGSAGQLDAPLGYPAESATTSSPGGNWSNSHGNLSAGTYYFNSLKLNPPHTLTTTGPVTIYVGGEVSIKGKLLPAGNNPSNLRIVVTSNKDVEFTATATAYAQIYAPLSDVTFTGNSNFHGGVVGKTLTMTGNSDVHQDLALPGSGSGGMGKAIALVE